MTAVCHIHSVASILAADDQEVLRTKEDSPSKWGFKDGWFIIWNHIVMVYVVI